jgi:hypothetical protein
VNPYVSAGSVKTEPSWYAAGDNKVMVVAAGTTFDVSQEVEISASYAGTYKLSALIDTVHNEATVSNFVMKVVDAEDTEVASVNY